MHKENALLRPITALMVLKRVHEHSLSPLEKETGLCRIELDILNFLMENPTNNTATAIIVCNHFSKSHVSGAIKHLEKEGYLRRFFDEKNRKVVYLALTEKAFEVALSVRKKKAATWNKLLKGIKPEDINIMLSTLDKLAENAEQLDSRS